jgi:hypothetical protein
VEDLNIEELKQLVLFYKQRASDVEFSMLQTQIKLNKYLSVKDTAEEVGLSKPVSAKK